MSLALLALIAFGTLVFVYLVHRQAELFMLSVRDGRVLVVRGRVPGGFLHDARSMLASAGVRRATIAAVRQANGARLVMSGGIDQNGQQRLRNVFALYPASKLRAAPPIARPTLGQVLGIAWLAWLLDSAPPRG